MEIETILDADIARGRSCAEDPSDEGTVFVIDDAYIRQAISQELQ